MTSIPKRLRNEWGEDIEQAIDFLERELSERHFSGPYNLKERCSFSFFNNLCETISVQLNFGRFSKDPDIEIGRFDSAIIVLSKKLYRNTLQSDPWAKGSGFQDSDLTPCYVDSLAHRKWAEQPTTHNPSWLMTTQSDVYPNLLQWLADFDRLHVPQLADLTSDEALIRKMQAFVDYRKPKWVLSDGPNFVRMLERLAALQRDLS